MANITFTVQSLLNTAVYNSYTVADTTTISNFKLTIQATQGFDPSWYALYFNNTILNDANTLASYNISNGSVLRSINKIARLATFELRQHAKLDLAALDRLASNNPRHDYDISELPTQYSGDAIVNNLNGAGLMLGRPWHTPNPNIGYSIITEAGDPITAEDGTTQLTVD
jgi:hypothetical protein